jgi:hypothetical protein
LKRNQPGEYSAISHLCGSLEARASEGKLSPCRRTAKSRRAAPTLGAHPKPVAYQAARPSARAPGTSAERWWSCGGSDPTDIFTMVVVVRIQRIYSPWWWWFGSKCRK